MKIRSHLLWQSWKAAAHTELDRKRRLSEPLQWWWWLLLLLVTQFRSTCKLRFSSEVHIHHRHHHHKKKKKQKRTRRRSNEPESRWTEHRNDHHMGSERDWNLELGFIKLSQHCATGSFLELSEVFKSLEWAWATARSEQSWALQG